MRTPRLLVIQHNLDDHLNELAGPLVDASLSIEPWFTSARQAPLLEASDYDGVLSLGALVGVKDEGDHRWMSAERGVLEKAVASRTPTLGVCFGAQLLASIAGAEIRRADSAEIGWVPVQMSPDAVDDPVLGALGPRPTVFQYHYDTFGEPHTGTILGRTDGLNQVLRVGDRAWGVQFHVEVGPGAISSWLGTYGEEMAGHGVDLDALWAETAARWKDYRRLAHSLAEAFAREIRSFAETR
jgi:GMP synthase (glutamine-hydrolysing)